MPRRTTESGSAVARILVVDDHPMMRQGVRDALVGQSDLAVVAEAEDVSSAMKQLSESRFDLVILDISFQSGANGIELIKGIRARGDDTRMLVFSMHDESLYAERVLRAGAQGYVEKSASSAQMVTAIRRVLRGGLYLSPRMSDVLLRRAVDVKSGEDLRPENALSDRELEVLELIGRGLTTRKIAETLCLSEKTIETHRQNIKNKLGLESGTQLIRHAVQWVDRGRPQGDGP
jgi:DNA-binding NarL/FixJ family response regulator